MSVELDYSTFVLLPGAVNPLIGMMMETDMWGTTIIVQDKQDGSAKQQKLSATASEFISSWDISGFEDEAEDKAGVDVMNDDYFDQQEQEELLHVPYGDEAMNDNFSSYEDDLVSHLWSRRGSLDGDSYTNSSHLSSRSPSPSPKNPALVRVGSDPFGVTHFANVSNSQLLQHQQLSINQPQRLRQHQLSQQLPQQPQTLLSSSHSSRQLSLTRVQPVPAVQVGRSQSNIGSGMSLFNQQRFQQPQNLSSQNSSQSSPSKLPRIPASSDPRTLRPPARNFYRPPRESGARSSQTIPAIRSRMPTDAYVWAEGY